MLRRLEVLLGDWAIIVIGLTEEPSWLQRQRSAHRSWPVIAGAKSPATVMRWRSLDGASGSWARQEQPLWRSLEAANWRLWLRRWRLRWRSLDGASGSWAKQEQPLWRSLEAVNWRLWLQRWRQRRL